MMLGIVLLTLGVLALNAVIERAADWIEEA
jgi:hypothetical protein